MLYNCILIYICLTLSILPLTVLCGLYYRVYYKTYTLLVSIALLWPVVLPIFILMVMYKGGKRLLETLWRTL